MCVSCSVTFKTHALDTAVQYTYDHYNMSSKGGKKKKLIYKYRSVKVESDITFEILKHLLLIVAFLECNLIMITLYFNCFENK